jgi:ABC-type Fe3+ transport system permease subunit
MKKVQKIIVALVLLMGFSVLAIPTVVSADSVICPQGTSSPNPLCSSDKDVGDIIKIVVDTLMFLIGVVAVLVIIIAGFRMVTSSGNAESMSKARNSIIYASIGIVVAVAASAIIGFVVEQIK